MESKSEYPSVLQVPPLEDQIADTGALIPSLADNNGKDGHGDLRTTEFPPRRPPTIGQDARSS